MMRTLLLAMLVACSSAAHAADWHVGTYGTRSTCSAGAGWGPEDVHPTIAAVINTCASSVAAGDTVTLARGAYGAAVACSASLNVTGSITIQGITGDYDDVTIGADTAAGSAALSLSCTAGNNDFVFKDLTITKSASHTAATLAFMMFQNEVRDVTLDNVRVTGLRAALSGNNASLSGAILSRFNGTRTTRTVTLRNVLFDDLELTMQNGFASVIQAASGTSVTLEGNNVFEDMQIGSTGSGAGTGYYGGIYILGTGTLSIAGTATFRDITSDVKVAQQNHAQIRLANPGVLAMAASAKVVCERITYTMASTSDTSNAACIETTGPFSGVNIEATDVIVNTGVGANNNGAVFLTSTVNSTGDAKVFCRRVSSLYGSCLYTGNGGTGRFMVGALESKAYEGIVYSGGWGTSTRIGGVIAGSDFIDRDNPGVVLELYSQIHPSTPTADKVSEIVGLTIGRRAEGVDPAIPAMYFLGGNTTYSHSVTVANVADDSGADVSAEFNEAASSVLNGTIISGGMRGTVDGADIVNGTFTDDTQVTGEPLFVGGPSGDAVESFKLNAASPYIRAGKCLYTTGCAPRDYGGRVVRVPPDIGAWQYVVGD